MKGIVWVAVVVTGLGATLIGQEQASVIGTVVDPLGARVPRATVTLLRDGHRVMDRTSSDQGEFALQSVGTGRYQLEVRAPGFESKTTDPFFVRASGRVTIEVGLAIGPLEQDVVVTAAATEVPASQTGAPVTVVDYQTLENLAKLDVLEALRIVPGAQVVQTGQRGGVGSLFVRGGASSFTKVMIDGVPANDIGGGFDFSNIATTGVESVEVLRQANSVLYGSDAMTGVVNITTRRGRSDKPEVAYSIDGGNLSTFRNALSIGGAVKRFDYFAEYSYFDTDNNVPNNTFTNNTFAGRFGVALGDSTDISATVRHIDTDYGSPNTIDFYGIPDDSSQTNGITYAGATAQTQFSNRLQGVFRFTAMNQDYGFVNPTPTGEPFDPFGFGPNYLGQNVTINGANGYSVSGQAILDYGGTYPQPYNANTKRQQGFGQVSYLVSDFTLSGGLRIEHESGLGNFAGSISETDRNNYGSFVEARGTVKGRHYISGGLGFEHNEIFGFALSPRISVASYFRNPSPTASVGDTKLTLNFGKGIKAPNIGQELSSLYELVQGTPAGAALGLSPIGPERSRTFDVGIEQGFAGERGRVRAAFFYNQFYDLIEFVGKGALPSLGVPPDAAEATSFGAYVNSQSYRATGIEMSAELALLRQVRLSGSYTFLDAIVTKSFSGDALSAAYNPAFPDIPIGQYGPLVDARPFRRPTHSGSVLLTYIKGPAQVTLAGYFAGKQDDSTSLSDAYFGYSMLLPNHNMDAGYQKLDCSGSYRIHPRLRWYVSLENVTGEQYEAAAGFPALPATFRTGVTVTLAGNSSRKP